MCDNQSALYLKKNPTYHERSRHIHIKLNFIRDVVASGIIGVVKTASEDNPTDVLTKVLPKDKFENCLKLVHMRCLPWVDKGG